MELVVEGQFLKDLFLLFKKGVVGSDGLPFLDLVYCGMGVCISGRGTLSSLNK